ncbi:hypothetical protein DFH29DRAFT_920739 [Suillus ampliporus]|nr:hypothetical protein DFH29DRAFT_920739 [Suillus ampliporus]
MLTTKPLCSLVLVVRGLSALSVMVQLPHTTTLAIGMSPDDDSVMLEIEAAELGASRLPQRFVRVHSNARVPQYSYCTCRHGSPWILLFQSFRSFSLTIAVGYSIGAAVG